MKKLFVLLGLVIAGTSVQAQKFGYVNAPELLYLMPEMKNVNHVLDSVEGALTLLYQKEVEAFNVEVKKCQETPTGPMRSLCEEEIQKKQEYLMKAQEVYKQELEEKQAKMMAPLNEKIMKAIKEVAIEKGLNYVFDISLGAVLYWTESEDINKDVRKKLGIAEDAVLPKQ